MNTEATLPGVFRSMAYITRDYVQAHPTTLFIMGDNMIGKGISKGAGQAEQMRGEPNTIGIPTKYRPSRDEHSYFTDASWNQLVVRGAIVNAFDRVENALITGQDVVIPSRGIGTGRAELQQRAPVIWEYIQDQISQLECRFGEK